MASPGPTRLRGPLFMSEMLLPTSSYRQHHAASRRLQTASLMSHQPAAQSASKSKVPTAAERIAANSPKQSQLGCFLLSRSSREWSKKSRDDEGRVPWVLATQSLLWGFSTPDSAFTPQSPSRVTQAAPPKPGSTRSGDKHICLTPKDLHPTVTSQRTLIVLKGRRLWCLT